MKTNKKIALGIFLVSGTVALSQLGKVEEPDGSRMPSLGMTSSVLALASLGYFVFAK